MTKNWNFSSDTSDSRIGEEFKSYELGTVTTYVSCILAVKDQVYWNTTKKVKETSSMTPMLVCSRLKINQTQLMP